MALHKMKVSMVGAKAVTQSKKMQEPEYVQALQKFEELEKSALEIKGLLYANLDAWQNLRQSMAKLSSNAVLETSQRDPLLEEIISKADFVRLDEYLVRLRKARTDMIHPLDVKIKELEHYNKKCDTLRKENMSHRDSDKLFRNVQKLKTCEKHVDYITEKYVREVDMLWKDRQDVFGRAFAMFLNAQSVQLSVNPFQISRPQNRAQNGLPTDPCPHQHVQPPASHQLPRYPSASQQQALMPPPLQPCMSLSGSYYSNGMFANGPQGYATDPNFVRGSSSEPGHAFTYLPAAQSPSENYATSDYPSLQSSSHSAPSAPPPPVLEASFDAYGTSSLNVPTKQVSNERRYPQMAGQEI